MLLVFIGIFGHFYKISAIHAKKEGKGQRAQICRGRDQVFEEQGKNIATHGIYRIPTFLKQCHSHCINRGRHQQDMKSPRFCRGEPFEGTKSTSQGRLKPIHSNDMPQQRKEPIHAAIKDKEVAARCKLKIIQAM